MVGQEPASHARTPSEEQRRNPIACSAPCTTRCEALSLELAVLADAWRSPESALPPSKLAPGQDGALAPCSDSPLTVQRHIDGFTLDLDLPPGIIADFDPPDGQTRRLRGPARITCPAPRGSGRSDLHQWSPWCRRPVIESL